MGALGKTEHCIYLNDIENTYSLFLEKEIERDFLNLIKISITPFGDYLYL